MSWRNARDEWRAARLAEDGNLETATGSLGIAAARLNHAAAEGVNYQ
jgi:hypothetical protein